MTVSAEFAWLAVLLAGALSASLCWALIPMALKHEWVDRPGGRKAHVDVTPILGGVAVWISLSVAAVLAWAKGWIEPSFVMPLSAGALVLLVVGLIDDRMNLSAPLRFLAQLAVCIAIMLSADVRLDDFGQLFTSDVLELSFMAVPITLFAAMGVINAFNLIDGMDGLAGSLFLLTAAGLAGFAGLSGAGSIALFLSLAAGAVAGFLLVNARFPWNDRARMFLGNSGSMMLGLILSFCLIRLGNGPERAFMPMTAVWMFAVPLLDTSSLIWRRWGEGRSAFSADQGHLHHAFLRAGFSVNQTLAGTVLFAALLALMGIAIDRSDLPEYFSFYVFMMVAFTYYFYLKHCWGAQKFLGRHFIHHDFVIEPGYE